LTHPYNKYIREALRLASELIVLSDKGEAQAPDDSCRAFYGVMRDYGYGIRLRAEHERDLHKTKGIWDAQNATKEIAPGCLRD